MAQGGVTHLPHNVSQMVRHLRHLRFQDIGFANLSVNRSGTTGGVFRVVCTPPAYFNVSEKNMNIKARLKELFHIHRFKTLLIYPPHNQKCAKPQCASNNDYGFLLMCDCGYTKPTKLPYGISEIFTVANKPLVPTAKSAAAQLNRYNAYSDLEGGDYL